MFPNEDGFGCLDDVFAIKESLNETRCLECPNWSFCSEFDGELLESVAIYISDAASMHRV